MIRIKKYYSLIRPLTVFLFAFGVFAFPFPSAYSFQGVNPESFADIDAEAPLEHHHDHGDSEGDFVEPSFEKNNIPALIQGMFDLEKKGFFSILDMESLNGYQALPASCAQDDHFKNSVAATAHLSIFAQYAKLSLSDLPARRVLRETRFFDRLQNEQLNYPFPLAFRLTSVEELSGLIETLAPFLPKRESLMAKAAIKDFRHYRDLVAALSKEEKLNILTQLQKSLDYKNFYPALQGVRDPNRNYSCYQDFTYYEEIVIDGRQDFMGHRPLEVWYVGFWLRRWADGAFEDMTRLLEVAEKAFEDPNAKP